MEIHMISIGVNSDIRSYGLEFVYYVTDSMHIIGEIF